MDEATLIGTVFSLCIFSDWIASGLTSEAVYVGTISTYSAAVALGWALCYLAFIHSYSSRKGVRICWMVFGLSEMNCAKGICDVMIVKQP